MATAQLHRDMQNFCNFILVVFVLCLTLIPHLSTSAASTCSSDKEVCTIDTQAATAAELFRLCTLRNNHLILQNNNIQSWDGSKIGSESPCATNIRILELHNVTPLNILNTGQPFQSFSSLRRLVIKNNLNFSIEDSIFSSLSILQQLEISNSAIATLKPTHLAGMTGLKSLAITKSKLHSLETDWIERSIPTVESIDLSHNIIYTLKNDTFGRKESLRSLILDGNGIQYIHLMAFSGLPNLETLSIRHPKERNMAKIWESSLKNRFVKNSKLKRLDLVDTKMSSDQINDAFKGLTKLERLNLSGNTFRQIHQSQFSEIVNLIELDLSRCELKCLFDRNFGILNNLQTLNLENNSITYIARRSFVGLSSLKKLSLSNNPVEIIEGGSFCTLKDMLADAKSTGIDLLSQWKFSQSVYQGSSVQEACPEGFQPDKLSFGVVKCPVADVQRNLKQQEDKSRNYLLIIVGVCVGFLIVTVLSIMTYRAWSRHKNNQIKEEDDKEMAMQAMLPTTNNKDDQDYEQVDDQKNNGTAERKPQRTNGASSLNGGDSAPFTDPNKSASLPSNQPFTAPNNSTPNNVHKPNNPKSPKITAMTTLPEDGDLLEAKAVTTLAVV